MFEFSSFFHAYVYVVRMHTKFLQTNIKPQTVYMNKICIRSLPFSSLKIQSAKLIKLIKMMKLKVLIKHKEC